MSPSEHHPVGFREGHRPCTAYVQGHFCPGPLPPGLWSAGPSTWAGFHPPVSGWSGWLRCTLPPVNQACVGVIRYKATHTPSGPGVGQHMRLGNFKLDVRVTDSAGPSALGTSGHQEQYRRGCLLSIPGRPAQPRVGVYVAGLRACPPCQCLSTLTPPLPEPSVAVQTCRCESRCQISGSGIPQES